MKKFSLLLIFLLKPIFAVLKLFKKKKIVIISDNSIVSFNVNLVSYVLMFALFGFSLFSFLEYKHYKSITEKYYTSSGDVEKLGDHISTEIEVLHQNIEKINKYFEKTSEFEHLKKDDVSIRDYFEKNKISDISDSIKRKNASSVTKIIDSKIMLSEINQAINNRIEGIHSIISKVGINPNNKSFKDVANASVDGEYNHKTKGKKNFFGQGGPFVKDDASVNGVVLQDNFLDNISYLTYLESILHAIPTSKPMKSFKITSYFGSRTDPFHKVSARHTGIDLVGPKNSPIFATMSGKVTKSERSGAYGNMVEVTDDFTGISTRYAHLSKITAIDGAQIKKGDIIGYQGTTGRSTGDHLHYEVRYFDKILNPSRFFNLNL